MVTVRNDLFGTAESELGMKLQKSNPAGKPSHFRADRLAELMRDRGLTQQDLAKYLDIHPSQISRWLNGANEPTSDTLARLSDYFRVSSDWLLGRVGDNVGYYQMPELSPTEWAVVLAIRGGTLVDAIQRILDEMKKNSQRPEEGAQEP